MSAITIKRLAQFLFDNADTIVRELKRSSHYRSISCELNSFKAEKPKLNISLSFYDEKATHYYLRDDAICIERFKQLCEQINAKAGITPLPKPVKVRKTLIVEEEKNETEKETTPEETD
jgi:hypothetical protein